MIKSLPSTQKKIQLNNPFASLALHKGGSQTEKTNSKFCSHKQADTKMLPPKPGFESDFATLQQLIPNGQNKAHQEKILDTALKLMKLYPKHGLNVFNLVVTVTAKRPELYNSLMDCYLLTGKLQDAISLFKQFKRKKIKPNEDTFNILIHIYCKLNDITSLNSLTSLMKSNKIEPSTSTYTILVRAYSSLGLVDEVSKILDLVKSSDSLLADNRFYTAIFDAYGQSGDWAIVINVFNHLKQSDSDIDVNTYNSIMNASILCNQPKAAMQLFDIYLRQNDFGDENSYVLYMRAAIMAKTPQKAIKFYDEIQKQGKSFTINISQYNLLMYAYSKLNDYKMVLQLFESLPSDLKADELTYTTVLNAFIKSGQPQQAIDFFYTTICGEQFKPTAPIYKKLIKAMCNNNQLDSARLVLNQMSNEGIKPDELCYNALIDGYMQEGQIESALAILDLAVHDGCFHPHLGYSQTENLINFNNTSKYTTSSLTSVNSTRDIPPLAAKLILYFHLKNNHIRANTELIIGYKNDFLLWTTVTDLLTNFKIDYEIKIDDPGSILITSTNIPDEKILYSLPSKSTISSIDASNIVEDIKEDEKDITISSQLLVEPSCANSSYLKDLRGFLDNYEPQTVINWVKSNFDYRNITNLEVLGVFVEAYFILENYEEVVKLYNEQVKILEDWFTVQSNFPLNRVLEIVIRAYLKIEKPRLALPIYDNLILKGYQIDTKIVRLLMEAFLAAKEPQTVIDIFKRLPHKVGRETSIYITLVNAYIAAEEYREVIKIWDNMLFNLKLAPDKEICIAGIIAAIYCDDLPTLGQIIREMRNSKMLIDMEFYLGLINRFKEVNVQKKLEILYFKIANVGNDEFTILYSLLLAAFIQLNKAQAVIDQYAQMSTIGVNPNLTVYYLLFKAYLSTNQPKLAFATYSKLPNEIATNMLIVISMIKICLKDGEINSIPRFMAMLTDSNQLMNVTTTNLLIKMYYSNIGNLEKAIEQLELGIKKGYYQATLGYNPGERRLSLIADDLYHWQDKNENVKPYVPAFLAMLIIEYHHKLNRLRKGAKIAFNTTFPKYRERLEIALKKCNLHYKIVEQDNAACIEIC